MISKVILLFLAGMMLLAIFGRLRFPGSGKKPREKFCPDCGRPRIGPGPCPCGRKG